MRTMRSRVPRKLLWVVGAILLTLLLVGCGKDLPPNSMQITVQGYQWWWGFQYNDADMAVDYGTHGPITTADVLVIPAGQTIDLSLRSEGGGAHSTNGTPDHQVIHSFWAPRLFG